MTCPSVVDSLVRRSCAIASVFACLTLLPIAAAGQTSTQPRPVVNAGRLAPGQDAPTIDGKVDESIWDSIAPYSTFTQQDPRMGEPATEKTDVRLLFSQTHVYVSFVCHDADP